MYSRVPGRQTVPGAELWAIIKTLTCLARSTVCRVLIHASYVIKGIRDKSRHYSDGLNGDLWTLVYDLLEDVGQNCNFIKVKSHVTTMEQWTHYGMTADAMLYNEGADSAANQAAKIYERNVDQRIADNDQMQETYDIARRLAAIQVECWHHSDTNRMVEGSSFTKLNQTRADHVKRKLAEAISNTTGPNGHDTYDDTDWWSRCRDCFRKAKVNNSKFWIDHPECEQIRKKR